MTSAFKNLDMRQLKQMQIRATTRDEVLGSDRELAEMSTDDRGEVRWLVTSQRETSKTE